MKKIEKLKREEIRKKYTNHWQGKKVNTKEYILSCNDADEIRALWYYFAPHDNNYVEHNFGMECYLRLIQLEKK